MRRFLIAGFLLAVCVSPAVAQTTTAAADHEALRKLKQEALAAANARDYAKAGELLYPKFSATVVTQDHFANIGSLKNYFESLYTRDTLRMKKIVLAADADELSDIHEGVFAITHGPTKEHYELADGRAFDLNGRWTAVSMKDKDGRWRILAAHSGVSFLDNPVISAIEHSIVWIAAAAGVAGLVLGFAGGWLVRGRRAG